MQVQVQVQVQVQAQGVLCEPFEPVADAGHVGGALVPSAHTHQ
ncbi:hypothetical protein HMPREF1550_01955 [Actinomyces sp. oral taxon 877 str. F0543]|nr:hypothetical protein HMPREF1550_01955 [Actinomyces sp. oral taxon 877 str. F0543]